MEELVPDALGFAGQVYEHVLGEEKYTFIEDVKNPHSCTILVKVGCSLAWRTRINSPLTASSSCTKLMGWPAWQNRRCLESQSTHGQQSANHPADPAQQAASAW